MIKEQFVGPLKVKTVVDTEQLTPAGAKIVRVEYVNGLKEILPEKTFLTVVSDVQSDYTTLRDTKIRAIAADVLKAIAEHDLKTKEIDELNRVVGHSLFESINRATSFLWTKDAKAFIPGVNSVDDVSLLDVEAVLKTIPNESQSS